MSQRSLLTYRSTNDNSRKWWGYIHRVAAFGILLLLGFTLHSLAQDSAPVKTVMLIADGKARQIETKKLTVQTLLHQEFIKLGKYDRCEPTLTSPVSDGMTVVITRVTCDTVTRKIELPAPTVTRWDDRLGNEPYVIAKGQAGLAQETTVIWKKDGVVTLEWVQQQKVIRQPSPTVVVRGTMPSRSGPRVKKVMMMDSSAYDPGPLSCGPHANGYTATGVKATKGVIAVDPRVIRLGTRVYVDGYGPALAADTGGAIKGNRIDVCFDTRREALNWGRRKVMVLIYE